METKVTKKEIRANFYTVISIGYCDAQYLLRYKNPFAYSCGVYGWNCDYYEVNNVCISTGYRPIGEKLDYTLLCDLENKARVICLDYNLDNETKKTRIDLLLTELINSIKK